VKRRLQRFIVAGLALAAAIAWAAYWAERFFASRRSAEAAMDALQKLMRRGYFSPDLDARVTQALEQSHVALALAFGGPFGIVLAYFSWRFFMMTREDR
jgi:predicted lipid-binding transport protein (Tim44 family)